MEEKRRFTRIFFSTPVVLTVGNNVFGSTLIDVSLKGALIASTDELKQFKNQDCRLQFDLPDSDISIEMAGHIVHVEESSTGIGCDKIDIESVTHLRRLIELNVGSSDLLDRDLESLSHP